MTDPVRPPTQIPLRSYEYLIEEKCLDTYTSRIIPRMIFNGGRTKIIMDLL